jgi:hypothetical protein
VAPFVAALAIGGGGALAFGGVTAFAWSGPPTVTAVCPCDSSHYTFQVSSSSSESDYDVTVEQWSVGPQAGTITTTLETSNAWPYSFSLLRTNGNYVRAEWTSDPGAWSATVQGNAGIYVESDSGVPGVCDPGDWSPCFLPNTGLNPGDTTTLTVTAEQDGAESSGMTTTLSWDGLMTFVSNGDSSAVCTAGTDSESCTYTDAAHQYKSDSFTFTVGANAPGTVVTTHIKVQAGGEGGCTDTAQATITMAVPVSTPTATATPTPATGVLGITSSPSPTPTSEVLGITTPSTGAGPSAGGWGWLSLALVLLGGALLVGQWAIRRPRIKIQDI